MNKNCIGEEKSTNNTKHILRIMRITVSLLFLSIMFSYAATSRSQETMLSLKLESISIKEACKEIEKGTGMLFVFSDNTEEAINKIVTIEAENKPINTILDELFFNTKLAYRILDKQIVIYRDEAKVTLPAKVREMVEEVIQLQKKTIIGKITDENGETVIGANIIEMGTSNGTISDVDGMFSLSVEEDATIRISYIGYLSQNVNTSDKSSFNIVLEEDTQTLEELVAVGYGTTKKINLTGAISIMPADALDNRPISSTGEGLQGIIPNLNINFNDGDPVNRKVDYNIRGFESINGGSPYILVDGIPMNIEDINPNDIESVSVLKDASASAIYGGKAAFGVILVTTKSATEKDRFSIKYSHESGWSKPILKGYDMVDNSYIDTYYKNQMRLNDGQVPYNEIILNGRKAYHESQGNSPEYEIVNGDFYYYGYTNWRELAIRDFAPTYKHNFSISGGTKKSNFYVSYGNFKKEGILKYGTETFTRNNILVKLDQNINDWVSLDQKIVVNILKDKAPHRYAGQISPLNSILTNSPVFAPVIFPYDDPQFPELGGKYFENEIGYLSYSHTDVRRTHDTWITAGITINPLKNILLRTEYSYHLTSTENDVAGVLIDFVNTGGLGSSNNFNNGLTAPSQVNTRVNSSRGYFFNAYAQYELKEAANHYLKLMLGFNQEKSNNLNLSATGIDLITPYVPSVNATIGDHIGGAGASHVALRGGFYRANYFYKGKYLLELSGRYDGTSKFPQKDRFGFFPSGSIGWRVSEENFMKKIDQLDNLKIRASYGELGNQDIRYQGESQLYPYISSLGIATSGYLILDESNSFPTYTTMPSLISSSLTWEKVATKNIGIDLMLFNQKLEGSFEYYSRETKDMLMRKSYPLIIGGTPPLENGADLRTLGWEFTASWRDKINKDFSYNLRFSLWDHQTEITKYYNPTNSLDTYYEGMKIGEIWGFETYGLFQTQEEIEKAPDQTTMGFAGADKWYPGDIRYVDQLTIDTDNDGIADAADGKIDGGTSTLDNHGDRVIIGNNTARYNYSFNIDLNYKNWGLGIFFQGVGKRDYYALVNGHFYPWQINMPLNPKVIGDYWTEENSDAYWYRPTIYPNKNHAPQTRYLQDASYLRLKSVVLKYKLPSHIIEKMELTGAEIFLSGQNLWEHSNMLYNRDPEHNTGSNLDQTRTEQINITYPLQRTIGLGINLTL